MNSYNWVLPAKKYFFLNGKIVMHRGYLNFSKNNQEPQKRFQYRIILK